MRPQTFVEPLEMDRRIGAAVDAYVRWARQVRGSAEALASDTNPLTSHRPVASRATYQSLQELANDLPCKTSLQRWVAALTIERVTTRDRVAYEQARRAALYPVLPLQARIPWSVRSLALEAVTGVHEKKRQLAAEALVRVSGDTSEQGLWWMDRRRAAARELGISLSDLEAPLRNDVRSEEAAVIVLEGTGSLADEVLACAPAAWQERLHRSSAISAQQGWPAHLTGRWLRELFARCLPAVGRLHLDLGPLPHPLCGGSFARALARFGSALYRAWARGQAPMRSVAEDPFDAGPARYGALFASLLVSRTFLRKRLGVGGDATRAQGAAVAGALLTALRLRAVQAATATSTDAGTARDTHARFAERALGAPVPEQLAMVLPRACPHAAARLVGSLAGLALADAMVEEFDTDWFDNPRAWTRLQEVDLSGRTMMDRQEVVANTRVACRLLGEPFV